MSRRGENIYKRKDGSGKTDIDFYVKAFGGDMYGKGEIRLFISNAGNGRKYEYSIDGGEKRSMIWSCSKKDSVSWEVRLF